jgi:hypothetical protein
VYVFNPDGGLGVGSYFQDTLQEGTWTFVVGIAEGDHPQGHLRQLEARGARAISMGPSTPAQRVRISTKVIGLP